MTLYRLPDLNWRRHETLEWCWEAETPFGRCRVVEFVDDPPPHSFAASFVPDSIPRYKYEVVSCLTIGEARRTAEAAYEKLVASALVPATIEDLEAAAIKMTSRPCIVGDKYLAPPVRIEPGAEPVESEERT